MKFFGSAAVAAAVAVLLVVSVAFCDLIWPVPNTSEPVRLPDTRLGWAVAITDSATVFRVQMSPDSIKWLDVDIDTATYASPAVIDSLIPLPGWYTRTVLQPLNSVDQYASTGPYNASSFVGAQGVRSSPELTTGLAYPDPSMTTDSDVHVFTLWFHRTPTDSHSVNLWIESPFVDDGSDPTTATSIDNTNYGDADSCGVDWFRLRVVGNGPDGIFPDGGMTDSAIVAQRDIVTLEAAWAHRGDGTCVQEFSITPPAGWTEIVAMDHEEIPVTGPAGASGSTVAQYRAPASLTDPITYLGAFRVTRWVGPQATNEESCSDPNAGNAATYGAGSALAYRADGDPDGDEDGFPGSLFLTLRAPWDPTGNEDYCFGNTGKVGEIEIPVPIRSFDRDDVNVAESLGNTGQPQGTLWSSRPFGKYQRQGGLLYLAAHGSQTSPKLYQSYYDYYTNNTDRASHTWADAEALYTPNTAGPWHLGPTTSDDEESLYHYRKNCAYAFVIPDSFVVNHLDGDWPIAAGFSSREAGTQGSNQGPSMTAFGPWTDGNPPATGDITCQPLLVYPRPTSTATCAAGTTSEQDYNAEDRWTGGFWPSKHVDFGADTTAVVGFVGARCRYTCYYLRDGSCSPSAGCPDTPFGGQCCQHRLCPDENCPGFICGDASDAAPSRKAVIAFYDEADIADVADGTADPWDPQPIYEIDISSFLISECDLGPAGVAWDDANGLLYVAQNGVWPSGAGIPSVAIHVFRVNLVAGT